WSAAMAAPKNSNPAALARSSFFIAPISSSAGRFETEARREAGLPIQVTDNSARARAGAYVQRDVGPTDRRRAERGEVHLVVLRIEEENHLVGLGFDDLSDARAVDDHQTLDGHAHRRHCAVERFFSAHRLGAHCGFQKGIVAASAGRAPIA